MNKKLTRREFNALAAQLGVTVPFLSSLTPFQAQGATLAPKRLILLRSKNAIIHSNCAMNNGQPWDRLKVKQNDPILGSQATQYAQDVYYVKLSDLAYTNNVIENSGLKNYKSKINVIKGLDMMTRHAHNCFTFLCGSLVNNVNANEYYGPAFTYSFDFVLEKKFINKAQFPLPVLRVLPQVSQTNINSDELLLDSMSYHPQEGTLYADYKRVPYYGTIKSIYQATFGSNSSTSTTTTTPTVSLGEKIRTQIIARSQLMQQKKTLSTLDKSRLQNYIDTMNGLPLSSGSSSGGGTTIGIGCTNGSGLNISTDLGITQNYQKTMDLVVQALACQISQVAVIAIGDNEHQMVDGGWHDLTHSTFNPTSFWKYEGFVASQVSYLVDKLANTLDADGNSMLDNTLVVWATEHSMAYFHEDFDMPLMTIGGTNLNIQNGYYIDYRKRNPSDTSGSGPFFYMFMDGNDTDTDKRALGRPWNDFLVTLFQAMGVSPSTYHAANLDSQYGSVGSLGSTSAGFGEYSYPVTSAYNFASGSANTLFKNVYRSVLPSDTPLPFFYKG